MVAGVIALGLCASLDICLVLRYTLQNALLLTRVKGRFARVITDSGSSPASPKYFSLALTIHAFPVNLDGTSNEGEASGDHSSSSTGFAARLLLPVDGERTEKWRQTAARVSATAASTTTTNNEAILNSIESMNMTTSFFAASSVEKSLSLRERWTEHTQTNAWDYLAATGKQRRIRASLSFPRPISLQHPLPTFHDPIDWIDAEEPKQSKHP